MQEVWNLEITGNYLSKRTVCLHPMRYWKTVHMLWEGKHAAAGELEVLRKSGRYRICKISKNVD